MDDPDEQRLEQAALVAHQIKSPVGTLQTILRTLLGGYAGELDDRQKKMLQSADRKCSEAMQTIKGLLAIAEAQASVSADEASDIVNIVRKVEERYRQTASDKDIDFQVQTEADSLWVPLQKAGLLEAVSALVDNAVKYTPEGGRLRVAVTREEEKEAVCLRVADSGIGIPEDQREELFQPFFRARNAREVMSGGTGLGLSFVRALAEAANGTVHAERSSMGGAEFVVEVPRVTKPECATQSAGQSSREPDLRVVVVGGVAAGPKIASKIMRLRPHAEVTVVEKGRVLSYAGCGLPYYISGAVKEQKDLVCTPEGVVRDPSYFAKIKHVRVMNRTEAVEIDHENRRVLVKNLISGEQAWLSYDKLAIATGALPIVPSIPGAQLKNIFTLHGLEHAEGIKSNLAEGRAKDVTIVGGGLIGVEMTESLVAAGCRVTLVEMEPQLLGMLDWEMSHLVRSHMESKGVKVMLNTRVTGFEGDGRVRRVITEDGSHPADMVIMGVGVRPNVKLAKQTGLELGQTGAIKVDEHMQTSVEDIYAAGDCVECTDIITGQPCYAPFGSTANKQGRVAAVNMCGGDDEFPGVATTTVCKVFDYTVSRTGLTESEAIEQGYNVVSSLTPGYDRAHFMPDAEMIVLKMVADAESQRLLGLQAIGPGEAAKRTDVAVTSITGGLTVDQVSKLDLCYAPSYSQALDNIHTACNVLKNKLEGHMESCTPMEVHEKLEQGEDIVFLDVRTHAEFDDARIDGSTHIPLGALRGRMAELPRDKEIIVFSRVSLSAYEASIILKANGFDNVQLMDGGIVMWPYGEAGRQKSPETAG